MSFNKDMSDEAIKARYDKANKLAVVTMNNISFASLQDILSLLEERNHLKEAVENLKAEIITLEE